MVEASNDAFHYQKLLIMYGREPPFWNYPNSSSQDPKSASKWHRNVFLVVDLPVFAPPPFVIHQGPKTQLLHERRDAHGPAEDFVHQRHGKLLKDRGVRAESGGVDESRSM